MLRTRRVGIAAQNTNDISHITQEMYKKNLELNERNKTLSLLRRIDDIVISPENDTSDVMNRIAEAIIEGTDFSSALIGLIDKSNGTINFYGRAGDKDDLGKVPSRPLRLLTYGKLHDCAKELKNTEYKSLSEIFPQEPDHVTSDGAGTVFLMPLIARRQPIGLFIIHSPQTKEDLSDFKKTLLERLVNVIGIAIDSKQLYEQVVEASAELRVKNKKLKELDKAKDEFISMASHQLRTPLTTVKGYISMMLDGDAGKLGEQQHNLLDLAYFSAQRMVFLITDLLNVSRINTGKFVIESAPVNLLSVVTSEIAQLQQTAATRNVQLVAELPKEFPTVYLDENKTRQVMMNFIDNALYYTPSGGTVRVQLERTPDAIEFRVVDNGIGVSEADKKKLFAKFYRADNAREQRPDGTGLGLFMAKKVIASQNGTIIFESQLGKGSTFGFRFALAIVGKMPPSSVSSQ